MGSISFFLIVAALIGGSYAVLRKINAQSYLYGRPKEAVEYRRAPARKPVDQTLSSRERKYVEWYLENGHRRQDARPSGLVAQPSSVVGVAFLAHESGQQRRASNG